MKDKTAEQVFFIIKFRAVHHYQLLVSEQLNPIVNVNSIALNPITADADFVVVNAEHVVMMAFRFVPAIIDAYRIRMTCCYVFAEVSPRYRNGGNDRTAVRTDMIKQFDDFRASYSC